MTSPTTPFTALTEATLDVLLQDFEAGRISKTQWVHATHLAVGGCYALQYSEIDALERLRRGIHYLNECHGVANTSNSGYHETLTRFWLAVIRHFLWEYRTAHPKPSRASAIQALVTTFEARRDLFRAFYSIDVVNSPEARRVWIAPDIQSLPGVPTVG